MTTHALFDHRTEATKAVADLRALGVKDDNISILAHHGDEVKEVDADGNVTDDDNGSLARGILGGGALGAGLGVAALAIPGVGPFAAIGAIAAAAAPAAMATGAAAGAALGSIKEILQGSDYDEADAEYYDQNLRNGRVLVAVDDAAGLNEADISRVLYAAGGHNAARART
ncbi:MAG: general stress protein [Parerythrobacter sp.]